MAVTFDSLENLAQKLSEQSKERVCRKLTPKGKTIVQELTNDQMTLFNSVCKDSSRPSVIKNLFNLFLEPYQLRCEDLYETKGNKSITWEGNKVTLVTTSITITTLFLSCEFSLGMVPSFQGNQQWTLFPHRKFVIYGLKGNQQLFEQESPEKAFELFQRLMREQVSSHRFEWDGQGGEMQLKQAEHPKIDLGGMKDHIASISVIKQMLGQPIILSSSKGLNIRLIKKCADEGSSSSSKKKDLLESFWSGQGSVIEEALIKSESRTFLLSTPDKKIVYQIGDERWKMLESKKKLDLPPKELFVEVLIKFFVEKGVYLLDYKFIGFEGAELSGRQLTLHVARVEIRASYGCPYDLNIMLSIDKTISFLPQRRLEILKLNSEKLGSIEGRSQDEILNAINEAIAADFPDYRLEIRAKSGALDFLQHKLEDGTTTLTVSSKEGMTVRAVKVEPEQSSDPVGAPNIPLVPIAEVGVSPAVDEGASQEEPAALQPPRSYLRRGFDAFVSLFSWVKTLFIKLWPSRLT